MLLRCSRLGFRNHSGTQTDPQFSLDLAQSLLGSFQYGTSTLNIATAAQFLKCRRALHHFTRAQNHAATFQAMRAGSNFFRSSLEYAFAQHSHRFPRVSQIVAIEFRETARVASHGSLQLIEDRRRKRRLVHRHWALPNVTLNIP